MADRTISIELASNNNFATAGGGGRDMKAAKEDAEELLDLLKKIEKQLVSELRS
jgi:hypothetical protein